MNQKGFSHIILLGIFAVLVLVGAGGFLLFPEKEMPFSEKTARQEVSPQKIEGEARVPETHDVEDVTISPIEPTPSLGKSIQPSQQPVQTPSLPPTPKTNYNIHEDVWTKNGYDGASYEFKVNCAQNYKTLNECFLWDLSAVVVTDPDGKIYNLSKDFNIQTYSGEVTRRWVLYGPAAAGLPKQGTYIFSYYRDGNLAHSQTVDYRPAVILYPTEIVWNREGNDLVVSWKPPQGMKQGMWYKVLVFRKQGQVISQIISWNASDARLMNVPLTEGEKIDMNVSSYFNGGYAYPQNIPIAWTSAIPKSASPVIWLSENSEWKPSGTPPLCPDPFVIQTPVEMSRVTAALWPGQARGGYKAHGGFRFNNDGTNDITVHAPVGGHLIQASQYLEGGEKQYFFIFSVPCGFVYRLDHLKVLSPKLTEVVKNLPSPTEGDSRTNYINPPVWVNIGEIIATSIGVTKNIFVDFGLYDVRKQNNIIPNPAWVELYAVDKEFGHYGVCFFDYLPDNDGAIMRSLPTGKEGKTSDYCK